MKTMMTKVANAKIVASPTAGPSTAQSRSSSLLLIVDCLLSSSLYEPVSAYNAC